MNLELTTAVGESATSIRAEVLEGLVRYNERFLGPRNSLPLAVAARDGSGALVGGATGGVYYDRLAIDLLWVEDGYRGKGLGSRILRRIEREAAAKGATRAFLDTFSFQAAPFYEKQGYREVARIAGYFGEYDRIYLAKSL